MKAPLDIIVMVKNGYIPNQVVARMLDSLAQQLAEDYPCFVDGGDEQCESTTKCKRCILTNEFLLARKHNGYL